jgi:hypothetical protein
MACHWWSEISIRNEEFAVENVSSIIIYMIVIVIDDCMIFTVYIYIYRLIDDLPIEIV